MVDPTRRLLKIKFVEIDCTICVKRDARVSRSGIVSYFFVTVIVIVTVIMISAMFIY